LEQLHRAGYVDIGPAHLAVFQYPPPDGHRPTDLAVELGVSKQALNYLLAQLEAHGYLVRPGRADAGIKLTRRGWRLSEAARTAVSQVEREWSRRLGSKRYTLFRQSLSELVNGKEP
jgi:DNA-binding MarR family transcriptional regulator